MKKLIAIFLLMFSMSYGKTQSVLYFLDGGGIERSRTDGTQRQVVIPGSQIHAQGIAIDVGNNRLYWTDWVNDKIQTSGLDGQQISDLVTTGLHLPEGIALDTMAGKMYWVDSGTRKIQRANLDGSLVEDLVTYPGSVNLDGIALDPVAGHMYWTDWGAGAAVGRVRRANLDGTQIVDLFTKPNGILKGIGLDLTGGKVYWTDCGGWSAIQRANLDGTFVEDLILTGLATPNSLFLDLVAGKMYWSDLGFKKVRRANFDGTLVEDIISQNLASPEGVSLTQCEEDGRGCFSILPTTIGKVLNRTFTLYPNPTRGIASLSGLDIRDEVALYDCTGKAIFRTQAKNPDIEIQLEGQPAGIYAIRIIRDGIIVGKTKLVKQKQ